MTMTLAGNLDGGHPLGSVCGVHMGSQNGRWCLVFWGMLYLFWSIFFR